MLDHPMLEAQRFQSGTMLDHPMLEAQRIPCWRLRPSLPWHHRADTKAVFPGCEVKPDLDAPKKKAKRYLADFTRHMGVMIRPKKGAVLISIE